MGIRDEYLAYCFDAAAAQAGIYEQNRRQQEAGEQVKNEPAVIDERGIRGRIPFIRG